MKLRECVLVCAALCVAEAAAGAAQADGPKEPGEAGLRIERVEKELPERDPAEAERAEAERARAEAVAPRAPAAPPPLAKVPGDAIFQKAYADVYGILSGDNPCSRFYGGPAAAARVFNNLAQRLKAARLGSVRTGSTMTGGAYDVIHAPTGHRSRLFEQAVINSEGPFYRRRVALGDPHVPNIGRYWPATREARALILLHELGHLLRGADGKWLLKDDGDDEPLSRRNTALVEENCGAQINALAAPPALPAAAADDGLRLAAEYGPSPDRF